MTRLAVGEKFESDVPGRLDRLPFSVFHRRVIVALGITWVLDGLEVTLVGAVGGALREPQTLHLSDSQIGAAASAYLLGAVIGALVFGRLTDALGRKKLFLVTLSLYLLATTATALSPGFWAFAGFRALTGAGIGGEYAAINSAIDELLPARVRGRVDLAINSSYWLGTLLGSGASLFLLNPQLVPVAIGWRLCFGLGAVLGAGVWFLRQHVPESPRWLLLHGRVDEASAVAAEIERQVQAGQGGRALPDRPAPAQLTVKGTVTFYDIARTLLARYRGRTILGLSLMVAQAFAYNAIFFTYALVLARFFAVPADRIGLYLIPFAIGNLLGPLLLGQLFDTVGRRPMIVASYGLGGLLLTATGFAFAQGWLDAVSLTAAWCAVFFVLSSAASAAYLTVSELFPVEMRGLAIALFYAAGTSVGGVLAPALFGHLIQGGNRGELFWGYALGGGLLVGAALVALFLGVAAEGKSLEALTGMNDVGGAPAAG